MVVCSSYPLHDSARDDDAGMELLQVRGENGLWAFGGAQLCIPQPGSDCLCKCGLAIEKN